MSRKFKKEKRCGSWYHQSWFRVLLILVSLDMIFFGAAISLNIDVFGFINKFHSTLRVLGGLAYILIALMIIHFAVSYKRIKKESYLLCQNCGDECMKKED